MTTQRGFTLIEMAIVLVIITIMIGGLAMPLSAQIQARRIAETNRTLEEAREAIIGYAMIHSNSPPCDCTYDPDGNGVVDSTTCPSTVSCPVIAPVTSTAVQLNLVRHYLPCPDMNGTDPEPDVDNDGVNGKTDLNNGVEDRYTTGANAGSCTASSGNLPWVTLGTAAQDAWGNRIHYSLTNDPDDPLDSSDTHGTYGDSSIGFSNSSTGNNHVCITSAGGCGTGTVASNVPIVLVSYGSNGWGARNVNGTKLKDPTSDDEKENTDADTSFVSRSPSKAGDAAGEFDDLVVWISDGLLRSRVCPAGGCP